MTHGERASLWEPREPVPLFFEAKGLVERLLGGLGYAAWFRAGSGEPYLHPGAASDIGVGETWWAAWVSSTRRSPLRSKSSRRAR